jgi:hypothetical protein
VQTAWVDSGSGVRFSATVTDFFLVYKNSTNFQDAHRIFEFSVVKKNFLGIGSAVAYHRQEPTPAAARPDGLRLRGHP